MHFIILGFPVVCSILLATFLLERCNYYSIQGQRANIPILISVEEETIEDKKECCIIILRAENREADFRGYRLYRADSEEDLIMAEPEQGADCTNLLLSPNRPDEYIIEAKGSETVVGTTGNRICALELVLMRGEFIMIRPLIQNSEKLETGLPSNIIRFQPES